MLPESASLELRELTVKRVHDVMDDILQRATRKRKSGSIPRESAPGAEGAPFTPSADQVDEQVRKSGADMFSLGSP